MPKKIYTYDRDKKQLQSSKIFGKSGSNTENGGDKQGDNTKSGKLLQDASDLYASAIESATGIARRKSGADNSGLPKGGSDKRGSSTEVSGVVNSHSTQQFFFYTDPGEKNK